MPRSQWNEIAQLGHLEPEPARTHIDPGTGAIQHQPAGRVWFTDRRHADVVYREQNQYEGAVRVIGVRRNHMQDLEEITQGPGWRAYVTREPVPLLDIDISDWTIS